MLILLAASIKIQDYAWYRFGGKRRARFLDHHPRYDLELESGEVFGLKPSRRGDYYFLVDASNTKIRYKVSPREANLLIKRSKSFRGKVDGISVKGGLRGPRAGQDKKDKLNVNRGTRTIDIDIKSLKHPDENADITRKLMSVKTGGIKNITFLQAREILPGEFYYFYDAASTLRSYRRVKRLKVGQYGNWAKDLEKAIESQIRGIDVEVGTVKMNGELRHLIVVVDL